MAEEFTTSGTVRLGLSEAQVFAAKIECALSSDRFIFHPEDELAERLQENLAAPFERFRRGIHVRNADGSLGQRVGTYTEAFSGRRIWRVYEGTSKELNLAFGGEPISGEEIENRLSYRSTLGEEGYGSVEEAAEALLTSIAPAQQPASA